MSRGGRGGARGGGGMRANALPFELDPELETFIHNRNREEKENGKEDVAIRLFPEYPDLPKAEPITDEERALVQIQRDMDAQRRAGPFWTGTKDQWTQYETQAGKKGQSFDPFEDASTYGKKHAKRAWRPADLTRIKLDKRFFPRELWDIVDTTPINATDGTDGADGTEGRPAKARRLGLVKKSVMDRLAKFDEGAEDANAGSDKDDDEPNENVEEGEDVAADPEDDIFEEDEEDFGGDYNAEQYFDGGDEDFDEGGGEDYDDGY